MTNAGVVLRRDQFHSRQVHIKVEPDRWAIAVELRPNKHSILPSDRAAALSLSHGLEAVPE